MQALVESKVSLPDIRSRSALKVEQIKVKSAIT